MATVEKVSYGSLASEVLHYKFAEALVCSLQLLIKGIRSFAPDNSTVIQFERPLTLIVGHNGAGKTVGC